MADERAELGSSGLSAPIGAVRRDGWTVKILVYGLFVLEVVQTIVITCDVFVKYGLNFGNVEGLTAMRHNWFSIPTISAINGTAVQLFFAYRIAKLSESRTLGVLVAILAITGGTAGIVAGVQSKIINDLAKVAVHARTALTVWLTITGACDVIIAISMTMILSNKRLGFNIETDDAITKIIQLIVETGTLTAVLAIITVVLFFTFPKRSYWNVPIDILGKLYSNNLMVILNRRIRIIDGSIPSGTNSSQQRNGQTSVRMDIPGIKVHREVWSRGDSVDHNGVKLQEMTSPVEVHPYLARSTHAV
ncbi:hypothetical protein AAF712_009736 [Marasmius tenuissimus]|uniref:DUF6534 domain-containing protein n=1 Tax=Marasmius tenuissimus TaxID=585030 RepID=A0ABR2ZP52_9AGAR